jgi:hypothetical protein
MEWPEQGVWHVWLFALVMAALAPWCVQMFARAMARRVRRETDATIARALAEKPEHRTTVSDVERVEGGD